MIITYKELSSLTTDLGFSTKTLYYASNHKEKHYHKSTIPKDNRKTRELNVPDNFLKSIQRSIVDNLLIHEEISPYATAYRYGGSTIKNAEPHIAAPIILKLDIRNFFDHIIYPVVKEKCFPENRFSEQNRILLTLLCIYENSLPQGAPTSPFISNIIMKDFDNTVGKWCESKNIRYTRYCDDMTFSGIFNHNEIVDFVKNELKKIGFYLNDKKTTVVTKGQKQIVTGIVVNEKLNVSALYRKKIRQEIYYCKRYGVDGHLKHNNIKSDKLSYLRKLLGKTNYILSVDSKNKEMQEYKDWVTDEIKKCV